MSRSFSYTPFLKFKSNEVAALSVLSSELKASLTPFFDIPRKDGMTRAEFETCVAARARKAIKWLHPFPNFFLDILDIPDSIATGGTPNYSVVIDHFVNTNYIPVVGLDRASNHNSAVFDAKKSGQIKSNSIALRLQTDDFSSFDLIEPDLADLFSHGSTVFTTWIVILDCRFCLAANRAKLASDAAAFLKKMRAKFPVKQFILTGSSIPGTIADLAKPQDEATIPRAELEIFHAAESMLGKGQLDLGDYTIVSPLYSELTLPPEMLQSVIAPKVLYSYQIFHYIARGGRIKTHGNQQYNEIAREITAKSFYRTPSYSWGDNFLTEKAANLPPSVTPGNVLKPTICAHITYMAQDYPS